MRIKTISLGSTLTTFFLSLYFTFFLNFVLTKKIVDILSASPTHDYLFIISIPILFVTAFTLLFSFFVTKHTTKPFFITLILISSIVNFIAFEFGIIFNKDMMMNIFETTPAEAASYFNLKLVGYFLITGLLPSVLLAYSNIRYEKWTKELLKKVFIFVGSLVVIGLIAALYYKDYASIARNNPKLQKDIVPTYYISSTIKYVKGRYFTKALPYTEIGMDAKRLPVIEKENYLVIVVVGETARAQNYQLNGYARPTNDYTKDINNLFYFKNATSCGTATAVSLPCMFSLLGKDAYTLDKAQHQDNVVDIVVRGGKQAVWIDNNTGCKGVCDKITSYQTTALPELKCSGEECTDDVMLSVMNKKIQSFNGKEGVIFLHLMGSHGPTYYKRYPEKFARFKPDCRTSDLQSCSDEEIVNSYDNTILYTDYVISNIIDNLKEYKNTYHTALFYVSDHGESLGENGIYLHGMPYDIAPAEQKHVPFMIWLSDKMAKHKEVDAACMRRNADNGSFSHDNIAHTLINLLDVRTALYDPTRDVLRPCEGKHEQ